MQARLEPHDNVLVLRLMGRIDVETTGPFRRTCLSHLQGKKVVFDMSGLNFVGSSGLIPFFETLNEFGKRNPDGFRFCGLSLEFKRLLLATPLGEVPMFESVTEAIANYDVRPTPREAAVQPDASLSAVQAVPLEATEEGPVANESVDLFSMVRASFEEKMGRPLDPVVEINSSKTR